jgi:hypothetical protein
LTEETDTPTDDLLDRLKASMDMYPDEPTSNRITRNCRRAAELGRSAEGDAFTSDDFLALATANGPELRIPVSEVPCSIGRGPEADHAVDNDGVSRIHCRLERKGLLVGIRDAASKNGTYVNGKRVASCCYLSEGDEVAIGNARFTVKRA